jgi:site-specific DNA-methyltransferase (adenine-specific)
MSGTVTANVLEYGTGALNISACRVPPTGESRPRVGEPSQGRRYTENGGTNIAALPGVRGGDPAGRWPTNVVFSHPPLLADDGWPVGDACADGCVPGCPVAELDRQSGHLKSGANPTRRSADKSRIAYRAFAGQTECVPARGADEGGASRFFPTFRYEAKAPTSERPRVDGVAHETVKPLALLRWLVRLVTPPGGTALDSFLGSGTTAEAALLEGFNCVGIERDARYLPLIRARLAKPLQPALDLFSEEGGVA